MKGNLYNEIFYGDHEFCLFFIICLKRLGFSSFSFFFYMCEHDRCQIWVINICVNENINTH